MKTNTHHNRTMIGAVVLGCVLAVSAPGAKFTGFGSTVDFDRSTPDFSPEKLQGKGALIIFFQSWCPICNGWAGKLFRDVEATHGENPGVMLIAIKTDGGSTKVAEQYMKSKGADLDKWFVGSDSAGKYYKKISGGKELYGYALINATGDIAKQGKAGMMFASGPNKGKYALGGKSVVRSFGKLKTLLPADGEYPGNLIRIARLAEMGELGDALKKCAGATRSKHKAEARALLDKLQAVIKARIDEASAILKDGQKDWGVRYEAYMELDGICKELSGQTVVAGARKLVLTMGREAPIRREIMAERDYHKIAARLHKASERSKPSMAKQLKRVGEKYADTKYGKLAVQEANEILGK